MSRRTDIPSLGLRVETGYGYGWRVYKTSLECLRCRGAIQWRPPTAEERARTPRDPQPRVRASTPYEITTEGPGSWMHDRLVRQLKRGELVRTCPHCAPPAPPETSTEATDEA